MAGPSNAGGRAMTGLLPPHRHTLCRLDDIPDGGAIGVPAAASGGGAHAPGLIVVRLGDTVRVYENACPHIGTPLDWVAGKFFSHDGRHLICATHGATFEPASGLCVSGPCRGDRLTALPSGVDDGGVWVERG